MAKTKFELYKDGKGMYRWRLIAQNGEPVASSGEGFTEKRTAMNAIKKLKDWASTETVIDFEKIKEEAEKAKEKAKKEAKMAKESKKKGTKSEGKKVAKTKETSKKADTKKAVKASKPKAKPAAKVAKQAEDKSDSEVKTDSVI